MGTFFIPLSQWIRPTASEETGRPISPMKPDPGPSHWPGDSRDQNPVCLPVPGAEPGPGTRFLPKISFSSTVLSTLRKPAEHPHRPRLAVPGPLPQSPLCQEPVALTQLGALEWTRTQRWPCLSPTCPGSPQVCPGLGVGLGCLYPALSCWSPLINFSGVGCVARQVRGRSPRPCLGVPRGGWVQAQGG